MHPQISPERLAMLCPAATKQDMVILGVILDNLEQVYSSENDLYSFLWEYCSYSHQQCRQSVSALRRAGVIKQVNAGRLFSLAVNGAVLNGDTNKVTNAFPGN